MGSRRENTRRVAGDSLERPNLQERLGPGHPGEVAARAQGNRPAVDS